MTKQVTYLSNSRIVNWTAPTLLNGWVNFDITYWNPAGYWKDPFTGLVYLRGLVKSGTMSAAIFNLPVGYRPLITTLHACGSSDAFGRLEVRANGDLVPTVGNNGWFCIDGVVFSTL